MNESGRRASHHGICTTTVKFVTTWKNETMILNEPQVDQRIAAKCLAYFILYIIVGRVLMRVVNSACVCGGGCLPSSRSSAVSDASMLSSQSKLLPNTCMTEHSCRASALLSVDVLDGGHHGAIDARDEAIQDVEAEQDAQQGKHGEHGRRRAGQALPRIALSTFLSLQDAQLTGSQALVLLSAR